jgi:hypothetical protein
MLQSNALRKPPKARRAMGTRRINNLPSCRQQNGAALLHAWAINRLFWWEFLAVSPWYGTYFWEGPQSFEEWDVVDVGFWDALGFERGVLGLEIVLVHLILGIVRRRDVELGGRLL